MGYQKSAFTPQPGVKRLRVRAERMKASSGRDRFSAQAPAVVLPASRQRGSVFTAVMELLRAILVRG
jgi:hypothetical protein